ncbi:MAG TPA: DUF1175 family protein [Terriglobales bacterium]|nr:DUF1175 family protein [Terriglobales bacterium]
MARLLQLRWLAVPLVCLIAAAAIAFVARRPSAPAAIILSVDHDFVPADGFTSASITARASDGRKLRTVNWRVESGRNLISLDRETPQEIRLHAGVTPGEVQLIAISSGLKPGRVTVKLGLDPSDEFSDGTPDFVRLQDQSDRLAFRRWFTFLAESTFFQKEEDRPAEVSDCAALIRFAYREALHAHDGAWANQWHLESTPSAPSVRKYDVPHTALGPLLFRTRPGTFAPEDINNGTFAEFANAETLRRFNAHFVSRDLRAARPGDLIFFRQAAGRMPYHTMIFLGTSHFGEGDDWLIYHTGPDQGHSGEIRRVTVEDLMHHPDARWRPLPQNPAFLGVYRWNVLREAN